MTKIFWDKDNIGFLSDRVQSTEHSHCVLQVFLSLDGPLTVVADGVKINGACVIINKNVPHIFSCENKVRLSILIEPCSSFAQELITKMSGKYLICERLPENIKRKVALIDTNDKRQYIDFIHDFKLFLGITDNAGTPDERITKLLDILQNCDCYDHTVDSFAKSVYLSSSRLSHLFREQMGLPLKSYILFHQLEKAFSSLLSGANITDAAMRAGFDSPSHFAATVKKWMGVPATVSIKDSDFLKVFM